MQSIVLTHWQLYRKQWAVYEKGPTLRSQETCLIRGDSTLCHQADQPLAVLIACVLPASQLTPNFKVLGGKKSKAKSARLRGAWESTACKLIWPCNRTELSYMLQASLAHSRTTSYYYLYTCGRLGKPFHPQIWFTDLHAMVQSGSDVISHIAT